MRKFDELVYKFKELNEGFMGGVTGAIGNIAQAANPFTALSTPSAPSSNNASTSKGSTTQQPDKTQVAISKALVTRIQTNNKKTSLSAKNVDHDTIILNSISNMLQEYANKNMSVRDAIAHFSEIIIKNL